MTTTSSSKPILTCRNLAVGYKRREVLKDLNLAFERGRFVALLGPNGAGKTTFLRTLSRHLLPLSGAITLEGMDLQTINVMTLARLMAVVLTDRISPPLFTVSEFVALGRYPHTGFLGRLGPVDEAAVMHALDSVNALDLALRRFSDLSDGEKQKALVARALAQEPKLLLLDEPTVHLDLKHRMEVMTILRDLCRSRDITVIASLHDVDVAARVSDRVALVKGKRLLCWGPPESVLTGESVASLYDFDDASFDRHLGGIEFRGNGSRGRAFVVAGMGSGAQVYRLLARQGFAITTGILHTNDIDYFVARSLGADCMFQSPTEPFNGDIMAQARQSLAGCDLVIDTGSQVNVFNDANAELVREALKAGKPVFSLRADSGSTRGVTACENTAGLCEALEAYQPVTKDPSGCQVKEAS